MAQESRRSILTAALIERLRNIRLAAGAHTEIGRNVISDNIVIDEPEAPCVQIEAADDSPGPGAGLLGHVQVLYVITGYAPRSDTYISAHPCAPRAEYAIVDALIDDIRKAVESCPEDEAGRALSDALFSITYQGATPYYQESAGNLVGAQLRYLIATQWEQHNA